MTAAKKPAKPLPCPFCGGSELHVSVSSAQCETCGAWGPRVMQATGAKIKEAAIAAWNRRAP